MGQYSVRTNRMKTFILMLIMIVSLEVFYCQRLEQRPTIRPNCPNTNRYCADGEGRCEPVGTSPGRDWQMRGFCDRKRTCQCWVKRDDSNPCENEPCARGRGKCFQNGEQPRGWERYGWCNPSRSCECWVPIVSDPCNKPCGKSNGSNGRGKCFPKGEQPQGLVRFGWCDRERNCECWVKRGITAIRAEELADE